MTARTSASSARPCATPGSARSPAVYPEARAEFDTTLIRLHASPAPLQQKLVPGAHLSLAADDKGTARPAVHSWLAEP